MTLLYPIGNSLYVNLTNLCCCKCIFCIRNVTDSVGGSDSLWLDHEPTMDELKQELEKFNLDDYEEVVFCGYGEPLMRINEVVEFAKYIKSKKDIKTRVSNSPALVMWMAAMELYTKALGDLPRKFDEIKSKFSNVKAKEEEYER